MIKQGKHIILCQQHAAKHAHHLTGVVVNVERMSDDVHEALGYDGDADFSNVRQTFYLNNN